MAVAANDVHRWTREEYERMGSEGYFAPDVRVELIDGIVYNMSPQKGPHANAVHRGLRCLQSAFPGHYIRVQAPLALADDSEPEPDLAVIPGQLEDYDDDHPTTAWLVVEVADSSASQDANRKVPLYARYGIPEVWLLNVRAKTLKLHSDPAGGVYRVQQTLRSGVVSPLTRPEAQIAVADLFPRKRIS